MQVPSPYAAMQHPWPQQQQQQQQQQAQQQHGMAGHGQAAMQYPYSPFMPMWLPYGMPPPGQAMPPGPFRMHAAGQHHPGAPRPPPNAGACFLLSGPCCWVNEVLADQSGHYMSKLGCRVELSQRTPCPCTKYTLGNPSCAVTCH